MVARLHLLAEIFAMVMLRRRTQTALVESERRFRVMADAAPVMIWMAGPDGGRIDFNRRWLEFTGRTLEQERGDGWFEGVHPTDRDACKDAYREALRARSPFNIEYRLRRADGSYRSVLDCGVPRFDGDAAFRGYVGSAIDITEAKAAHEDAERGREELGHALRVATLGELTATLAHEINQPLTGIFSTAQGMRRVLEAGEPTRVELREAFRDVASTRAGRPRSSDAFARCSGRSCRDAAPSTSTTRSWSSPASCGRSWNANASPCSSRSRASSRRCSATPSSSSKCS